MVGSESTGCRGELSLIPSTAPPLEKAKKKAAELLLVPFVPTGVKAKEGR